MAASGWGLCRRSCLWCHSLVLVLEPSSAPSGPGIFGEHLVLSLAVDDLPGVAAAAWEAQRWCSKRIITRTGFCMAKPVPVDVQEDTGVCQAQLPLSGTCLGGQTPAWAPGTHPNP